MTLQRHYFHHISQYKILFKLNVRHKYYFIALLIVPEQIDSKSHGLTAGNCSFLLKLKRHIMFGQSLYEGSDLVMAQFTFRIRKRFRKFINSVNRFTYIEPIWHNKLNHIIINCSTRIIPIVSRAFEPVNLARLPNPRNWTCRRLFWKR